MFSLRRVVKYSVVAGAITGTAISLSKNQYDVDAIGIVRLGRAASTVFRIALDYKKALYAKNIDPVSPEYITLRSQVHKAAAEKLLNLCCTNKGVYIKVGQHIGALDYLVPKEYVDTMKVLHSHAPSSKLEEIYKVLREDLKEDPLKIFASIEPEPIGTASLAQVHKARLIDGTTVAVKVQHPSVRGNSRVDMKTMEILVSLVSWAFPEFKFQWLTEETKRNIPIELDFTQEGHNAEKVKRLFKDTTWLKVPAIHWDLTTQRVLTMEFVEGGQVNDLEYIQSNKINPYEVSSKLGRLYSQMIFVEGFVHSDPHPGNIFVRKNSNNEVEIVLLDHGLYATLSNDVRCEYSKLWLSIFNMDKKGMRQHCEKLGVGDLYGLFACMVTGRTWDALMTGIDKTKFSVKEKALFQKEIPGLLPQISDVLARVNRQILLILKTNDLMRGIEHTLKTETQSSNDHCENQNSAVAYASELLTVPPIKESLAPSRKRKRRFLTANSMKMENKRQMTSFRVMSRCCIESVYKERLRECKTSLSRYQTLFQKHLELFRLNVYYVLLNLRSLNVLIISMICKVFPARQSCIVEKSVN